MIERKTKTTTTHCKCASIDSLPIRFMQRLWLKLIEICSQNYHICIFFRMLMIGFDSVVRCFYCLCWICVSFDLVKWWSCPYYFIDTSTTTTTPTKNSSRSQQTNSETDIYELLPFAQLVFVRHGMYGNPFLCFSFAQIHHFHLKRILHQQQKISYRKRTFL